MGKPSKHYSGWRIRWTDENGRRRSKTCASKQEAQLELRREELATEERRLGLRAPHRAPRTFAHAADYWEHNRAPKKRSYKDDLSMLRQLREHFSRIPLGDIGLWVTAVDRYKAKKNKLHDKTVANHLTLLGSILRLARDLGWTDRLPTIKKPSGHASTTDYRYLRNEEEVGRFLRAARKEGGTATLLYTMAIYTGMRAGELAALEWSDINWSTRLITVQRSFDGPTKSDRVRHVPILDALLPQLRQWRLQHPGRLVLTNRDGKMLRPSGRVFQEVLHRVLDTADFPKVNRRGKTRRYITFHDLRHTFASLWVAKGGDLFKLQKILGHATLAMTQRYAHLQPEIYQEDHGRFGTGSESKSGGLRRLASPPTAT